MAKDIITAHNAFIEGVYSTTKDRLAHFLPEKPAKVHPSEVNDNSNCIVGNSKRWECNEIGNYYLKYIMQHLQYLWVMDK